MTMDKDEWMRKNLVTKCPVKDMRYNPNKDPFNVARALSQGIPPASHRKKHGCNPKTKEKIDRIGTDISTNRFADAKNEHRGYRDATHARAGKPHEICGIIY